MKETFSVNLTSVNTLQADNLIFILPYQLRQLTITQIFLKLCTCLFKQWIFQAILMLQFWYLAIQCQRKRWKRTQCMRIWLSIKFCITLRIGQSSVMKLWQTASFVINLYNNKLTCRFRLVSKARELFKLRTFRA